MRRLTAKDLEILVPLCEGQTRRQIASILDLTESTVVNRLTRLRMKYDARTTIELVAVLITNNMLLINTNVYKVGMNEKTAHDLRVVLLGNLRKNINKLLNTYMENL